jgi:murein L,D-transpeptidase YafK
MTDAGIEEIYLLAAAALEGGQAAFQVHVFPFRMTETNMARHAGSPWMGLWQNLRPGYLLFEETGVPPGTRVADPGCVETRG